MHANAPSAMSIVATTPRFYFEQRPRGHAPGVLLSAHRNVFLERFVKCLGKPSRRRRVGFLYGWVTEGENRSREEFGMERLGDVVRQSSSLSAEELMHYIFSRRQISAARLVSTMNVTIVVSDAILTAR